MEDTRDEQAPGAAPGLPATGRGSPASWRRRAAALLIDWSASMLVAMGLFGTGVLTDAGWRLWMPMAVFFVEKTLLTALSGASFGQRLMRLSVVRTSGERVGPARCAIRTALVCLVLPAVVIGADRRSLNDVLLDTVVVSTR